MNSHYVGRRGSLHSIKPVDFVVKEILFSHSYVNVLRGLHCSPYRKLIYIMRGRIYAFWWQPPVACTENSSLKSAYFEEVIESGSSLLIPENALYGFYAVTEVDMLYLLEGLFDANTDLNYNWLSPNLPFKYAFPKNVVNVSEKDSQARFFLPVDYLLLGSTGFLGSYMETVLQTQKKSYIVSIERLDNLSAIESLISKMSCKYIICAAGISGRPTIQWCEDHEEETFQINYLQTLNLMELAKRKGIHLTIFGTGLLYYSDSRNTFKEYDRPNLFTSVYGRLRIELESHISLYPNVLILRILYPVSGDHHSKCFLTKMCGRAANVHNKEVAITVVPVLFPLLTGIIESGVVGLLNFVNRGSISLSRMLSLFNVEHVTVPANDHAGGFSLCTNRLAEAAGHTIPTVEEALLSLCCNWDRFVSVT